MTRFNLVLFASIALSICTSHAKPPNVLFIISDDLNHWIEPYERNLQSKTPQIARLAQMGLTFTNAHCAAPACGPSRAALMGGRRPSTSGLYSNGHPWKSGQKPGEGLSAQFLKAGYYVAGAGKVYHKMTYYSEEWSEYMSNRGLSRNGPDVKKYDGYHNDRTFPNLKDDDLLDWQSVDYVIERLSQKREEPFFLACGLYKPHLPFVVPRKYYDAYPLDSIELPPYKENDLDDIPKSGQKLSKSSGDHKKMLESGRWKAAIQSYLATIAYTDMNVGRLLDAYEKSPDKDNTIIVFMSDHGWSLGEKNSWRKFALWEEPTRIPFIWVVPGMTPAGTKTTRPVDLMSVYPTLCSLTGIQKPTHVEGKDITPILKNPNVEWEHPALITFGRGSHAIRSETHRYIRYADGGEELYHNVKDPYEWTNQANNPEYSAIKKKMAAWLPKTKGAIPINKKNKENAPAQ